MCKTLITVCAVSARRIVFCKLYSACELFITLPIWYCVMPDAATTVSVAVSATGFIFISGLVLLVFVQANNKNIIELLTVFLIIFKFTCDRIK